MNSFLPLRFHLCLAQRIRRLVTIKRELEKERERKGRLAFYIEFMYTYFIVCVLVSVQYMYIQRESQKRSTFGLSFNISPFERQLI